MTTVIATTMIDSSTESRANAIWNSIQSNANKMQTSDVVAYYQLVRLNIKSLTQVLGIVDAKLLQEISTASLPTDTGIIDEVTKT